MLPANTIFIVATATGWKAWEVRHGKTVAEVNDTETEVACRFAFAAEVQKANPTSYVGFRVDDPLATVGTRD